MAFRRHTLLPLNDCLYSLAPTIPRDRTSKFAIVQLHSRATKLIAAAFLGDLIKALAYIPFSPSEPPKGATGLSQVARGIQFINHDHHHMAGSHIFGAHMR